MLVIQMFFEIFTDLLDDRRDFFVDAIGFDVTRDDAPDVKSAGNRLAGAGRVSRVRLSRKAFIKPQRLFPQCCNCRFRRGIMAAGPQKCSK